MIPVGMFVVNASTFSSHFLTLFRLIVAYPSFEHLSVIYLFMVVVRAALLKADERDQGNSSLLAPMIWVSVVVHLMLSLLTNIFATSIIASKAWCVHIDGAQNFLCIDCRHNTDVHKGNTAGFW